MLILLDGLDEVPVKRETFVVEQIRDFCDRHSLNRFVTSCRIAAYRGGFNRFADVTMAEFDDEQIEQFINRWFSSELDIKEETAQKFWNILQTTENSAAKELAQTPLLLTFLCLVYDRSQSLPTVRSTLYGDALNILLKEWAAEKRLEQDPIYQGFHVDLEKELLAEIAYVSFAENQLFFSKDEITQRIAIFLEDTLDAPKSLDGTTALKAIERQQGILVERATDAYSFSHLTLQEYLVAKHISSQWMIDLLVDQHLTDKRWREIFLLVSGLSGRRSHELWLVIEERAHSFVKTPRLQALLRWATARKSRHMSISQSLAIRGFFLSSVLEVAIDLDIAIDIDVDIATTIAKAIDIASNSSGVSPRAIAIAVAKVRAIAIDIDSAIAIAGDIDIDIDVDSNIDITRALISAGDRAVASEIEIDIDIARYIDRILVRASDIDISYASDDIASDVAAARALANNSDVNFQILGNELTRLADQIPVENASAGEWKHFTEQLTQTYFDAFHLDKDLVALSNDEVQLLEKYLDAIKLILDCKAASVRVSRQQWKAIESRLLAVSAN